MLASKNNLFARSLEFIFVSFIEDIPDNINEKGDVLERI